MKKFVSILLASLMAGFMLVPFGAAAVGDLIPVGKADPNIGKDRFATGSLYDTLDTVANYVVGFLVIVAIFYILWAAYDFVTSSGSEEKVNGARRKIMYAAVGIIVALLAKGVVAMVIGASGGK